MVATGYTVFPFDPAVQRWAQAAQRVLKKIDTSERRHGRTWFVGVDALPNDDDGSIDGVPLKGSWFKALSDIPHFDTWHNAQISIVYPGYPKQDSDESDAAHRFRINRDAAHVDGLLPEGPDRRRHLREPHAFIAGIPLSNSTASPLVVWDGSHQIIRRAFQETFAGIDTAAWGDIDVTEIYQSARKEVFETCQRVEVPAKVGEVTLIDRHLVHGVAPWRDQLDEDRAIAYFRPMVSDLANWL